MIAAGVGTAILTAHFLLWQNIIDRHFHWSLHSRDNTWLPSLAPFNWRHVDDRCGCFHFVWRPPTVFYFLKFLKIVWTNQSVERVLICDYGTRVPFLKENIFLFAPKRERAKNLTVSLAIFGSLILRVIISQTFQRPKTLVYYVFSACWCQISDETQVVVGAKANRCDLINSIEHHKLAGDSGRQPDLYVSLDFLAKKKFRRFLHFEMFFSCFASSGRHGSPYFFFFSESSELRLSGEVGGIRRVRRLFFFGRRVFVIFAARCRARSDAFLHTKRGRRLRTVNKWKRQRGGFVPATSEWKTPAGERACLCVLLPWKREKSSRLA